MICRWLTSLLIVASLAYSLAQDVPSSCPSWSAEFNPVNNIQVGGSAGSCNSTAIEELLTLTHTILELLQNQEPCCTPSPTPGACAPNPCQNGGTCIPTNEGLEYQCTCPAGYTGATCASDVDECASSPCQNGGTCTDEVNGYSCECLPGFTGTHCSLDIDECASSPCQNGSTCTDEVNGYSCECLPGFIGTACLDIDECASSPCQNGGTCTDEVNGYSCECLPGFIGTHCSIDIDECASNPCQNGSTCTDEVNGYSCECLPGFNGTHCSVDIDECASSPCQNGGTCTDEVNGYSCECLPGFIGTHCSIDIDECASNPCQNGGTCTDEVNGYSCECLPGFNGTHCSIDIDECASSPCQNGGTCTDEVNGYSCECLPGFIGTHCVDIDECASNPCQNGGTCTDEVNGYSCECLPGFNGTHCSLVPQDCADIMAAGADVSGVYYISPDGVDGPLHVYCDMDTDGGGWTVFQRREDGSVDFFLEWDDYKHGFGNVSSEHWLGNDNIHHLSTQKTYELRVDLEDFERETRFAVYSGFTIGDEAAKYVLTVGAYSGNAGDSLMSFHSGHPFSTKDRDNDSSTANCANDFTGAWWYVSCYYSNLNGLYLNGQTDQGSKGVTWYYWRGIYYSLKKTEMKIRPL